MTNVYSVLAIIGGIGLALQVVINAQLAAVLGDVAWATAIQAAVGLAALAMAALLMGAPLRTAPLAQMPWWLWTGGLIGAAYILLSIILIRRLGAGLFVAIVVVGQLATAVVMDHYGWLGLPVHRISAARLIGAAFLAAGVALIRWR